MKWYWIVAIVVYVVFAVGGLTQARTSKRKFLTVIACAIWPVISLVSGIILWPLIVVDDWRERHLTRLARKRVNKEKKEK